MRLLVVEDEARLAGALAKGFRHAGFEVDVELGGSAGLLRATETSYDAILLDLMLPDVSGYEIIRQLRARKIWTPILVLSAKDGEYDEADGLDLGADDYLTKPFSFVVLLAHLRALLRRGAMPRPTVLESGSLVLDPDSHVVTKAGVAVSLTSREFAMLEYFLRRPGRIVSKAELLDRVWPSADIDPNAVEQYVGYLRRKLGRETLETVRGLGYRLSTS